MRGGIPHRGPQRDALVDNRPARKYRRGRQTRNEAASVSRHISRRRAPSLITYASPLTADVPYGWRTKVTSAAAARIKARRSGAPLGKELSGKNMATCVLASARDDYSVAYAIAEFGKPLFGYQGPFRIVMPNQKKAARPVRMLEKIEVISLKPEAK